MNGIIQVIILSMLPVSELRGGIPLAIAYNFNPFYAFFICTLANILIVPIVFIFLDKINFIFLKIPAYNKFFHRNLEKAQHKIHSSIEKYGYLGLMFFVAIPLPLTGAYSGALGAWALGMDKKKSFLSIALGVIIAGLIVTIVSYYSLGLFNIFIKKF